jgi:hypothetical protein
MLTEQKLGNRDQSLHVALVLMPASHVRPHQRTVSQNAVCVAGHCSRSSTYTAAPEELSNSQSCAACCRAGLAAVQRHLYSAIQAAAHGHLCESAFCYPLCILLLMLRPRLSSLRLIKRPARRDHSSLGNGFALPNGQVS